MKNDKDIMDTGHAIPRVIDVEYLGEHKVFVRFDDGKEGGIDFSDIVGKGVFAELKDSRKFARFGLEHGTLVWSAGLDVSAEYLYRRLH